MADLRIGIDVGGTGIKGAVVDLDGGSLVSERFRIETPSPATPEAVVAAIAEVVEQLDHPGPLGVGFPAVIVDGVASTANNVDDGWIGKNVRDLVAKVTGREVSVVNDADAAGLAEVRFGAGRNHPGKVLVLTFGTGIGSGLMVDGELMPNLELGQIELDGVRPAELKFSANARNERGLSWPEWGADAARYIELVNSVVNAQMVVFGGGAAKHWDKFVEQFSDDLLVVRAKLSNNAGIVGAAVIAPRD